MSDNKIVAKCIIGHKFDMTVQMIRDAQATGCAMCPMCGNAATITKIMVKAPKKLKG